MTNARFNYRERLLIWLVSDQHIVESTQNIRALSSYFVYACCCLGTRPVSLSLIAIDLQIFVIFPIIKMNQIVIFKFVQSTCLKFYQSQVKMQLIVSSFISSFFVRSFIMSIVTHAIMNNIFNLLPAQMNQLKS